MEENDEDEGTNRQSNSSADPGGAVAGLYGWPSLRIIRVSRTTGGKDRHSKVLTSRGLRDRRVRLLVNTAIQFYDLQDRLGYDQPSKAVEWLLSAAANSIAELPPMNSPFPMISERPSEKKMIAASGGAAAKSSSSENSKGSGLSISRSDCRIRARERAKERVLEREKENEEEFPSFSELLSVGAVNCINGGGGGGGGGGASLCRDQSRISNENSEQSSFYQRFPMDYFNSSLSSPPATASPTPVAAPLLFTAAEEHNPELQHFSFTSNHLISSVNASAINRGTLQSNSSPHFPQNFFNGAAAPAGNQHQFFPELDDRLQLYYGNAYGNDGRHSGPKRKDKP